MMADPRPLRAQVAYLRSKDALEAVFWHAKGFDLVAPVARPSQLASRPSSFPREASGVAQNVGGSDSRAYWSSFLVTFPIISRYKAYSLAPMRTPTSVSLSVREGVSLH